MKLSDFTFAPRASASTNAACAKTGCDLRTALALLDAALAKGGKRPAVCDADKTLTYEELNRFSARLGRFLQSLEVGPERFIGIMLGRETLFIAALCGVLRAGGAYVPIDPSLPLSRRRDMLRDCGAVALISQRAFLGDMNTLQWECPALANILCLDAEDFYSLSETPGELMSTELWDYVASDGADDIQAGGWKSPYTGQWLSREIMDGYAENVRAKLAPLLCKDSSVLEIGCASGITMARLAPLCGSYLGIDLSERVLARAGETIERFGLKNVTLQKLRADEIGILPKEAFEGIIVNSVIESFPGLNYLRKVLDLALERLTPNGFLFLGNIWDLDRRDGLVSSLEAFARENEGRGYTTKLDMTGELFVSKAFFKDWAARKNRGLKLVFSDMQADERELAAYGFDLIIRKDGRDPEPVGPLKGGFALCDFSKLPETPPAIDLKPEHPVYAIFTSGTTGRPKGAVIEHRNLVNLIDALTEVVFSPLEESSHAPFNQSGDDRFLQLGQIASFSFDASVQLIFAGLAGGHTLHLTPDEVRRNPARLNEFLEERAVDVLDCTPSLLSLLLDHWRESGTSSRVRSFVVGGEALRPELLERFYAVSAHARSRIINAYGPTECCVDSTLHVLTCLNRRERAVIPIGKPIRGMEAFILDSLGRILPPGVPGEIVLAGNGVGRGYCNAPGLTAERFVPHPTDAGRRAYKTGDLGRMRSDGVLEFLRRDDTQVKVRGYRIELGEIEAALLTCPGVRQAAVSAGDFLGDGVTALAAYVAANDSVTPTGMREHLLRKLPGYMIPSYFVFLERLPLNVSGKLDRRNLPRPVAAATMSGPARPPETPTEKRLAEIWADLLKVAEVDVEADFFSQGGHSILAVRLVSLVEKTFGARIPLDGLFAGATIRKVAKTIDEILGASKRPTWSPLVTARAEGGLPPLLCFHPVGGNILCYQDLAKALGPNQPVYMIQSYGLEPGQEPLGSVEDMAALYLDEVAKRLPEGPYALSGWSFGGLVAYEAARQLTSRGRIVSAVALMDTVAVPDRISELLSRDESEYLATIFAEAIPLEAKRLRAMDPDERIAHIMAEGIKRGVFPADIDRGHMGRLLDLFQKNGLAAVRYRAQALPLSILLLRPQEITASALNIENDPMQGWGERALGGVTLCHVPGSHATMLIQPNVLALAAAMAPYLRSRAEAIDTRYKNV